ncbi:MAG: hypothetical protein R2867_24470 [Caldilineaceae bacterium]
MAFALIHHYNRAIEVGYDNQLLFTYVYLPSPLMKYTRPPLGKHWRCGIVS